MISRLTTWAEVRPTMYVRGAQGTTYRVEDERDGMLLLQDVTGERIAITKPDGNAGVTVMEPNEEEALATVMRTLNAEVLVVKEQGKEAVCPPLSHRADTIHSHFQLMHGVWTRTGPGSRSVIKLLEQHREDHLHDTKASHAYVPHQHR